MSIIAMRRRCRHHIKKFLINFAHASSCNKPGVFLCLFGCFFFLSHSKKYKKRRENVEVDAAPSARDIYIFSSENWYVCIISTSERKKERRKKRECSRFHFERYFFNLNASTRRDKTLFLLSFSLFCFIHMLASSIIIIIIIIVTVAIVSVGVGIVVVANVSNVNGTNAQCMSMSCATLRTEKMPTRHGKVVHANKKFVHC